MAHAELFMDASGGYRWVAFWDDRAIEVSRESYRTAEQAYAASLRLPLTIVPVVRDGDVRPVSDEDAVAPQEAEAATEVEPEVDPRDLARRAQRRVQPRG